MCASTESQDSNNFCWNCLVMEENLNESVEAASVPMVMPLRVEMHFPCGEGYLERRW
jgi:hypothetical protein